MSKPVPAHCLTFRLKRAPIYMGFATYGRFSISKGVAFFAVQARRTRVSIRRAGLEVATAAASKIDIDIGRPRSIRKTTPDPSLSIEASVERCFGKERGML